MKNMMLVTVAAACVGVATPSIGQQATSKAELLGSWKVLSLKTTTGNNVAYPLGDQVAGYVTITADRIWLLFVDSKR